ncbi:MAG: hypothetical protein MUF24_06060 [Chitinophagaceae bacterium]|nr:hypothetical protein [Chitinophagaceae bacterium]
MDTLLVKPRNKKEFALAVDILKQHNIPVKLVDKKAVSKKKVTRAFLDSLPERMEEVRMHLEGKTELPDARDLLHEI